MVSTAEASPIIERWSRKRRYNHISFPMLRQDEELKGQEISDKELVQEGLIVMLGIHCEN